MSIIKLTPIKVGPWGSDSGNVFNFNGDGDFVLKKVIVRYWGVIDSLTFEYECCGESKTSARFGGDGGQATETLSLDSTGNLLKIEGTYGKYLDKMAITSLSFVTTSGTYGPYGKSTPTSVHFEMPTEGGKIVGFTGKFDDYVSAIGAYMVSAYI